jgi:hypothetical protein
MALFPFIGGIGRQLDATASPRRTAGAPLPIAGMAGSLTVRSSRPRAGDPPRRSEACRLGLAIAVHFFLGLAFGLWGPFEPTGFFAVCVNRLAATCLDGMGFPLGWFPPFGCFE